MKDQLTLEMSPMEMIIKSSEGNPGAATALTSILKVVSDVDPDSAFGMFGPLFDFDAMGITGSNIWILFSDVCDKDPVKVITLFRGAQLGFLPENTIIEASRRQDRSGKALIDFEEVLKKVQKRLPAFAQKS